MTLTGAAKVAGVVGWPIAHSLSPLLHSHWLAHYRIDGAYVPLAVRRADFSKTLRGFIAAGFKGLSVTVPHKEAAYAVAHARDAAADAAGSANLLVFDADGSIRARNTDSEGLAAHLRETLGAQALVGKTAVLAGAGGAARASVLALSMLGIRDIAVVNRNRARADGLAAELAARANVKISAHGFEQWSEVAVRADILVNATSAGMKGAEALSLRLDPLPKAAVVCDLVYNPLRTALLRDAHARGHATVDGLGMLLHQAVPAFEAFYGVRPEVTDELRSTLEKALDGKA